MVKVEVELNDVDASNLINILYDERIRMLNKAKEYKGDSATMIGCREWYEGHAKYLDDLKLKIIAGMSKTV